MSGDISSVFPIGAKVRMGEVKGVVVQVCIMGPQHIQYQVAWWSGYDRKTEWLESCEVSPREGSDLTMRIGFAG